MGHANLPLLSPKVKRSDKVKVSLQGSNCFHSRVVTTKKSIFQLYHIIYFFLFHLHTNLMNCCLYKILYAATNYYFSWFQLSLTFQKACVPLLSLGVLLMEKMIGKNKRLVIKLLFIPDLFL